MKRLGYIAIVMDLAFGNSHYIYLLSSAEDEWYIFDVCQSMRLVLWIFVALFWIKNGESLTEKITVAWYGISAIWDVIQTIAKTNGNNPTIEILVFLVGAALIQLYFISHDSKKKGTNGG